MRLDSLWHDVHRLGSIAKTGATRRVPELVKYRLVRPLTARRRPGAVVVLHTARCGSTLLSRMLGQHPCSTSSSTTSSGSAVT